MDELIEPQKITEEMKGGLARLWADNGIRSYLINAIAIANQNVLTCLKSNKPDEAKEFAARLDVMQKLLEKGKSCYANAEKIRSTTLLEQIASQDAVQKV